MSEAVGYSEIETREVAPDVLPQAEAVAATIGRLTLVESDNSHPADYHADVEARSQERLASVRIRARVRGRQTERHSVIDPVGQYLREIGQVPLLKAQEEIELSKVVQAGLEAQRNIDEGAEATAQLTEAIRAGAQAKERFINANLRLVVSVAKRYPRTDGMELLDLIQEGNLGLEHAVDKFDWQKGYKFSTYATYWIRQAIGRAIDTKNSLIRLPGDNASRLRSAMREHAGDADKLDPDMARLHRLSTPTSLDKTLSSDGESDMHDVLTASDVSAEDIAVTTLQSEYVRSYVSQLPSRQQAALEERYGLRDGIPKAYKEIGRIIGITPEGARRLTQVAERQLRQLMTPEIAEV